MPINDPGCGGVNAGELARIFGVSRRWIYKLRDQGMPREGRLFDVATCVQWQLAAITERARDEPDDIMEARKRLYIAQEAKTRLEVERLRGDLVSREEAEQLLMRIGAIVAAQLDAVAPRMAPAVAGMADQKEIQTYLFDEHRIVRESISRAIMELAPPGGGDDSSSTEEDSGGVGRRETDTAAGIP